MDIKRMKNPERFNPELKPKKSIEDLESEMKDKFADIYTTINGKYTDALNEINKLKAEIEILKKAYPIADPEPELENEPDVTAEDICAAINKMAKSILINPISDGNIELLENDIKEYFSKHKIYKYTLALRRDLACTDIVNVAFDFDDVSKTEKILVGGSND